MRLSPAARAPILAAAGLVLAAVLLSTSLLVLDGAAVRVSRYSSHLQDDSLAAVTTVAAQPGDLLVVHAGNGAPETFSAARFLILRGGEGDAVARGANPVAPLAERRIRPSDKCCLAPMRITVPDGVKSIDVVEILEFSEGPRPPGGDARVWFDKYVRSKSGDVGGTPEVFPRTALWASYALGALGILAGVAGLAAGLWSLRPRPSAVASGLYEAGLTLIAQAREQLRAIRAVALIALASLIPGGVVMVGAAGELASTIDGVDLATWITSMLIVAWLGILASWGVFAWRAHTAARRMATAIEDAPNLA